MSDLERELERATKVIAEQQSTISELEQRCCDPVNRDWTREKQVFRTELVKAGITFAGFDDDRDRSSNNNKFSAATCADNNKCSLAACVDNNSDYSVGACIDNNDNENEANDSDEEDERVTVIAASAKNEQGDELATLNVDELRALRSRIDRKLASE